MSVEKNPFATPVVTPLLRACKRADKDELQQLMNSIMMSGISKDDVNFADKNGRTALSYICVTPLSLTSVLEFLLRFKGIDVNKPDNEGNTPLHFAAETGQSHAITLLIRRYGKSLVIDSKNSFGLTPLMKAAVQGRTDCVARLIAANASVSLKDPGRGLTAKDWAHLCGRKFCVDAMGEIMKKRRREMIAERGYIPTRMTNQQKPAEASLSSKLRSIFHRPKVFSGYDLPAMNQSMDEKVRPVPIVEVGAEDDLPAVN